MNTIMSEIKRDDEPSDAKRGRYNCLKQEEEEFELEIHHDGVEDEFEVPNDVPNNKKKAYDYEWDEDEDENVEVQARSTNSRNRLKRSLEGQPINYEKETDPSVIARRTKQVDYGKSTPEYFNYVNAVPKPQRQPGHPKTPNKYRKYSRRAWDGIVKQWRISLHGWSDYPQPAGQQLSAVNDSDTDKFNESFTSQTSGSTTSSVAAAFSAELGFLNRCGSGSESENETNTSRLLSDLNSTVVEKKVARQDQIKKEAEAEKSLLSASWADEVEEYLDDQSEENENTFE